MVSLVPLEAAIKLPTFLSKTMFTNPEWVLTDADRELYIQAFRKCELAKSKVEVTPLTNLLATSFRRAYFHEACHSLSVHRKWFQGHGRKSAQQLLQELDYFCRANSSNMQGFEDEGIKLRAAIETVYEEEKLQRSHLDQGKPAKNEGARRKFGSFVEVLKIVQRWLISN